MINIAKILKDYPKGTKLFSPLFGEVEFIKVRNQAPNLIDVNTQFGKTESFYSNGTYNNYYDGEECLLFPSKENRDWTKFQKLFKDGDIVTTIMEGSLIAGIFNAQLSSICYKLHAAVYLNSDFSINQEIVTTYGIRLATEEEKELLFKAIKDNGYYWNEKSKTLEKLIEPKFKVGDRIRHKSLDKENTVIIDNVFDNQYTIHGYGVIYFKDQDNYELIPNKFDINTLKPFDKVLVRDNNEQKWRCSIFSHYDDSWDCYKFCTTTSNWRQCVPYNDDTKHLLRTNNDCDEYYKNW